jgi:DNA-binding transcriptional regulator YdaS (Cro superfamily)
MGCAKGLTGNVHGAYNLPMKLADYLSLKGLNDAEFAEMIGRHRASVTRYRNGRTRPDWDAIAVIERVTAGAVTAADFVPEPSLSPAASAGEHAAA